MGLKFRKNGLGSDRELSLVDKDGDEVTAITSYEDSADHFLLIRTVNGNYAGLTRDEALQFAAAIIREATR